MSIVQTDQIDAIGIDKKSQSVVLTISDHLTWEEPQDHLLLLQEKLNTYIRFYESEEIFETYPKAVGKEVIVEIIGKYPLIPDGEEFIQQAKEILKGIDVGLKFTLLED